MAWRSRAALLHTRLGERAAAHTLAVEEVELARELGAPRAIGVALQAFAVIEGGHTALASLEEAVEVLRESDARLEHARGLCGLGSALRRANRRVDSRAPLREALSLASELGAKPLAEHAYGELLAAGGRPRRSALRGPEALTASERRAAALAAEGRSNREIATMLVVTTRTVEFHLSRAYDKLGISSRAQLAAALASGEVADERLGGSDGNRGRPPRG
jgi:DNA-binding CsgD family transcriptional regulator